MATDNNPPEVPQNKLPQTDSEQSLKDSSDPNLERLMRRLWILATEMFGHKWTASMGESPNRTWTEACREFTEENWSNAVLQLKRTTDDWPPSLPEFRRWAYMGKTTIEAKEMAARKADFLVAAEVAKYNPNCAGITNREAERLHDRLSRSLYVDEIDRERNEAMGIEHQERDPLRICPDEEYR